jgi:hypothetical protein
MYPSTVREAHSQWFRKSQVISSPFARNSSGDVHLCNDEAKLSVTRLTERHGLPRGVRGDKRSFVACPIALLDLFLWRASQV